ncbi:MAG TPA: YHS domain-containing (seleno)protein [Candidatus Binatia bacterium]|nr:YHS domain-containing (seleno)protein [Candidatus Binatia bacterium]
MTNLKKAPFLLFFALLATAFAVQLLVAGEARMVNTGPNNVAIKGYDPVAYFTKGQPIKGKPEVTYSWTGAEWRFANAAHRDMFAGDPERYAPQFGGFCSMALARGKIKDIDPEAWVIVDGRLYLNFSKPVREKFQENVHKNIKQAEVNWKKSHR